MKASPCLNPFAKRLQRSWTAAGSALLLASFVASATAETVVYDANGSFVVPAGVTSVTVEAWGGGGGGGYNSAANSRDGAAGGGGGGGGFSKSATVPVTPGLTYEVVVGSGGRGVVLSRVRSGGIAGGAAPVGDASNGQAGGDTFFEGDDGVTVLAKGGAGASADDGGNGGSLGLGDAGSVFAGGNGGAGSTNAGGGGGGAAQASADGTAGVDGSGVTGGNGGSLGGGKGGNKDGAGQDGTSPGAGGGGNGRDGAAAGNGAAGRLVITYTVPNQEVQTGLILNEEDGMVGGGMLYRPMPGVINADGSYAMQAFAKVGYSGVTVANDELLLTNRSGSLRVVAREGSPVPGGGYLSNGLYHLAMSRQGTVFSVHNVRSTMAPGPVVSMASLLSSDGVDVELVKRRGGQVASGGTVSAFIANMLPYGGDCFSYSFRQASRLANVDTRLDSETVDGSVCSIVAAEGQDVSSLTGDPAWLGEIGRQFSTGGEELIFAARLQNNPANIRERTAVAANEGLFCFSAAGGMKLLMRKGDEMSGTGGAKAQMFYGVSRSETGKHAVHVMLNQPLTRTANQALVLEDAGAVSLVARMGVTPVTGGLTLARIGQYYVTNDGAVVFTGWLAGASYSTDGVICRWTADDGIEVIAREGDAAPNTGRNYHTLTRLSVSPSGVILYQAILTGVGSNGAVYRQKSSVLEKLVQIGDDVLFEGAPVRVLGVGIYDIVAGGGNYARAAVNDAGQALVALSLGNGKHVNRVFE